MKSTLNNPSFGSQFNFQNFFARHESRLKNPSLSSLENTAKIAGYIFGICGTFSACSTFYAANYLTALPKVIIRTTAFFATTSAFSAVASYFCFSKTDFWDDPAYVARRSEQAAKDIEVNKLGYIAIQQKYGAEIALHELLSGEDLKNLLKDRVLGLTQYVHFLADHGSESLKLFSADEEVKKHLTKLFEAHCRTGSKERSNIISTSYSSEKEVLDLSSNDILKWTMSGQVLKVIKTGKGYFDFTLQFETSAREILDLTGGEKTALKKIFLDEILKGDTLASHYGFELFKKQFAVDIQLLDISEDETDQAILRAAAEKAQNYAEFKKIQGSKGILRLLEVDTRDEIKQKMRGLFLQQSYSNQVSNEGIAEATYLGINLEEVFKNVENDIEALSYDDFIKRHTKIIFVHREFLVEEKAVLRQKFCYKIERCNLSVNEIKRQYETDIAFLEITDDHFDGVLLAELQRCKNYRQFEERNGQAACQRVLLSQNKSAISQLHFLFSEMPTADIIDAQYQAVAHALGFTSDVLQGYLKADIEKLSYQQFIEKRGLVVLEKNKKLLTWASRQALYEKLDAFLQTRSLQDIEKLESHAIAWEKDLAHFYYMRWNGKKLDFIFKNKNEFEVFEKVLQHPNFTAEKWTGKAVSEVKGLTIRQVLQEYKPCFELGILSRETLIDGKFLWLIAENELQNKVSTLHVIYKEYDSHIFAILKDTWALKGRIQGYVNMYAESILKGESHPALDAVVKCNVLNGLQGILTHFSQSHQELLSKLDSRKSEIQKDRDGVASNLLRMRDRALSEEQDKLKPFKSSLDDAKKKVDEANLRLLKILSDIKSTETEIVLIKNNKLTKELSDIQFKTEEELNKALKELDNKIEAIQKEEKKPVTGLRHALADPQEADKKERIKKIEGEKESLSADFKKYQRYLLLKDPAYAQKCETQLKSHNLEKKKQELIQLSKQETFEKLKIEYRQKAEDVAARQKTLRSLFDSELSWCTQECADKLLIVEKYHKSSLEELLEEFRSQISLLC